MLRSGGVTVDLTLLHEENRPTGKDAGERMGEGVSKSLRLPIYITQQPHIPCLSSLRSSPVPVPIYAPYSECSPHYRSNE